MTIAPAIECRSVWKIFGPRAELAMRDALAGAGKDDILKKHSCIVGVADATFTVNSGEIFCIMGLSGSGKSTLIRHINRLIEPTSGEILIEGIDVGRLSPNELRELRANKTGMVFQSTALLPYRTVRDNISMGLELKGASRKQCRDVAEDKLEMVSLKGWGDRYPDELSGGMRQRVGLARAMAVDPKIILMDEPFSALDPLVRRELQDQFLELSRKHNKTVLFITHDLDEAVRIGTRIAIMRDGRIIQTGTPSEIVLRPRDNYIADFVRHVSRLEVIRAKDVMRVADHGTASLQRMPKIDGDASLQAVIDSLFPTSLRLSVLQGDLIVGEITAEDVVNGLQTLGGAKAEHGFVCSDTEPFRVRV